MSQLIPQSTQKIIIVYGCPGSGKTTFSYFLLSKFNEPVLMITGDLIEQYFNIKKNDNNTLDLVKIIQKLNGTKLSEHTNLFNLLLPNSINNDNKQSLQFDPKIWKQSRDFIKNNLDKFTKLSNTIIIQDDFLLKSTRKPFRIYCAKNKIRYLQIQMQSTLQQCISLNQKRDKKVKQQVIIEKFNKFQGTGIGLTLYQRQLDYEWINQHLKVPIYNQQIQEQQKQDKIISQSEIQMTELQIRKYISQLLSNEALLKELLNKKGIIEYNKKELGLKLSNIKKKFNLKLGFLEFQKHLVMNL